MRFQPIARNDVARHWHLVSRWIDAACAECGYVLPVWSVWRNLVEDDNWHLLLFFDKDKLCGAATVMIDFEASALHFATIGGTDLPEDWLVDCQDFIVPIAEALGLREMIINGRLGWHRVLKRFGFEWDDERGLLIRSGHHGRVTGRRSKQKSERTIECQSRV